MLASIRMKSGKLAQKNAGGEDMRDGHPFWRGAALAFVFVLMMVLLGTPDMLTMVSLRGFSRELMAFAGMAVLGACTAAIPRRLRNMKGTGLRSDRRGCLLSFVGGLLLAASFGICGAGEMQLICGAMQGGMGAMVFVGCAAATAWITSKLTGRWQQ